MEAVMDHHIYEQPFVSPNLQIFLTLMNECPSTTQLICSSREEVLLTKVQTTHSPTLDESITTTQRKLSNFVVYDGDSHSSLSKMD